MKMYKECLQTSKEKNNLIEIWVKERNIQSCEEEIQMAAKHIKRYSFSPVIEECTVKQNKYSLFTSYI